ncbi:ankyrin [Annulohypoxylon maeteangense]|uniref:ankyrin n=1 Tax=Annulohypoxylon maeteangense TaxID=1927788 RepID=UPI002007C9F0|nr:ankyrin [Annulohypoxylon maeteangense]KAI0886549.1 ankyrin [Annulohypoxylon maeteangense]
MDSNRADSIRPFTSSEPAFTEGAGVDGQNSLPVETYTPNVFDLVLPIGRARDTVKPTFPPAFLESEAVDSSLFLGRGASFTVTRQAIPAGPENIVELIDMGGWTVESVVKAPTRPRHVVYKSARVAFQPNGKPATRDDSRALQSVLTEFHALLHPALLKHPNIIDFLGLAWGTNHADPLHRLPVLVVEYGDRGTLADVQLRGPSLTNDSKLDICLGIARGLKVLHDNGIIHGDVKPDNIVMCSRNDGSLVPKLADFGFAMIESTEAPEVMIGSTRTWRAPEVSSSIPVAKLRLTDVYSFGLVTWSLAIDGKDPFSLFISDSLHGEERLLEIDRLKQADKVLSMSKLEAWLFDWGFTNKLHLATSHIQADPSHSSEEAQDGTHVPANPTEYQILQARLRTLLASLRQLGLPKEMLASAVLGFYRQQAFFKHLDSLFSHTLTKDPDQRDLLAVIKELEGHGVEMTRGLATLDIAESSISADGLTKHNLKGSGDTMLENILGTIDWHRLGFKSHLYSWQMTKDLDPNVQTFIVNTLFHPNDDTSKLAQAAYFLNGYGVSSDVDQALDSLVQAARRRDSIPQAFLYRVFKACQKDIPSEVPILQYLKYHALRGSRKAMLDLKELDSTEMERTKDLVRFGYGGVGADWYLDHQWFHGLTQSTLMSKDFRPERLGPKTNLADIAVNKRGDRITHASAAVGAYGLLRELITDFKLPVDLLNSKGETALLCACRSGHAESVKLLLDNGASASIQSASGESPLHWLSSFKDKVNVAAVGKDLIEIGEANVDAFTTCRISHSIFPGTMDVDFQPEGTPLLWAVHDNKPRIVSFLLSAGADPNWRFSQRDQSPLEWAAYYHHTECLRMMIEHLEGTGPAPMTTEGKKDVRHTVLYGPLIRHAVRASDKFSMIMRNGADYLNSLKSTLALLQEKTRLVKFSVGTNETLIHYAVKEAHDEACKIILESGWLAEEINKPAGPESRTALLESVRWNRRPLFQLLVQHGADVNALSASPYDESGRRTWSALHTFADQAHNDDLTLVDDLITAGVPVDGNTAAAPDIETPLHIAARRHAFRLADRLRSHGANIDATCLRAAFLTAPYPLTGLGWAIALNARYSLPGLRYLLAQSPSFVVEPERGLTVLHLAACVPADLSYVGGGTLSRVDFDWDTHLLLVRELLDWFQGPEKLDARTLVGAGSKTALHLAAEYGNVGVVKELVRAKADLLVRCEAGETALDIAKRVWGGKGGEVVWGELLGWLE